MMLYMFIPLEPQNQNFSMSIRFSWYKILYDTGAEGDFYRIRLLTRFACAKNVSRVK